MALKTLENITFVKFPFNDGCWIQIRTGILQFVDETIKYEHALSPKRPIFVIRDSFGGCLAISVAARNPKIDLVLILINPGKWISYVYFNLRCIPTIYSIYSFRNSVCKNSGAGNIACSGFDAKQPFSYTPTPSEIFDR